MAQCPKCMNQDLEYKSGVSQKTGKQWQGYKCKPCNIMMGMDGKVWGDKGSAPKTQPQAQNGPKTGSLAQGINPNLAAMDKKLDLILKILKANFPEGTELVSEESTPF